MICLGGLTVFVCGVEILVEEENKDGGNDKLTYGNVTSMAISKLSIVVRGRVLVKSLLRLLHIVVGNKEK